MYRSDSASRLSHNYSTEFKELYLKLQEKDSTLDGYSSIPWISQAVADELRGVLHVFVTGSRVEQEVDRQYLRVTADYRETLALKSSLDDKRNILYEYCLAGGNKPYSLLMNEGDLLLKCEQLQRVLDVVEVHYNEHGLERSYKTIHTMLSTVATTLEQYTSEDSGAFRYIKTVEPFVRVARYELATIERRMEVAKFVMGYKPHSGNQTKPAREPNSKKNT